MEHSSSGGQQPQPKPHYLGPEYAAQFKDRSVAEAYRHRPPYPAETFDILLALMRGGRGALLDAGCGRGDIARSMVALVERVDAVDFSQEMIERGKALPGGDNPHLNWIYSPIEQAPLNPPYDLVTAGASLHWMDWDIVLPLFARALRQDGYLAIVATRVLPPPWDDSLKAVLPRFSTNRDYTPFDMIPELERRRLFIQQGEQYTASVPFIQSVEDYIESFHSMNGFSRERMRPEMADAFDAEVRQLVTPYAASDELQLQVVAHALWGWPGALSAL